MIFPGQGSQSVGMLAALAEQYPEVQATFAQASEILGFDLWQIAQEGPTKRLDETVITQPVMLAAGVATWRAWRSGGGATPSNMAGHSLGEYTALVCSGSLEFADAIRLVTRRAELMQAAVPPGEGAMAAIIGLDDDAVIAACDAAAQGQVVSAVNFNSPGQVVIAGERAAVERATQHAKAAGAKRALLLNVSVPSHCELMRPAAEQLAQALAGTALAASSVPVTGNADVRTYEDAEQIREGLAKQLYSPVRWTETIRELVGRGSSSVVECGPGKVLTGLVKRIDRSIPAVCIDTRETMTTALAEHAAPPN
ncbi:MAG TPA: ACP S-malonyltransferase [Woeseiaceae bacterium]|nr:ACP S-malonyltransferase [Woeseiaceae bacterium]